jgi:hypothetical protein
MGKKSGKAGRGGKGAAAAARQETPLPFVSLITPTYNRRRFIPQAIRCYLAQDYPRERMEWVVVDDGEDEVRDLFEGVPGVVYVRLETRLPLGKKRNHCHTLARGEIFVYMDDDDYYPPQRVSHAVASLLAAPKDTLVAGTSEIYVWFLQTDEVYQFGPYHKRHCTAGTFAFRRELLRTQHYLDDATYAEEKAFLKDFTLPVVQLDPMKTMLVVAHSSNTVDKSEVLRRVKAAQEYERMFAEREAAEARAAGERKKPNAGATTMGSSARESFKKPRMWIKDPAAKAFYEQLRADVAAAFHPSFQVGATPRPLLGAHAGEEKEDGVAAEPSAEGEAKAAGVAAEPRSLRDRTAKRSPEGEAKAAVGAAGAEAAAAAGAGAASGASATPAATITLPSALQILTPPEDSDWVLVEETGAAKS